MHVTTPPLPRRSPVRARRSPIGRVRRFTASPARLAALGIALRHFTDQLGPYRRLHPADLHPVTTVLTKQVEALITCDDEAIAHLLVDPDRVAAWDGTTARDLLADAWNDFVADVGAQVASTRAFVRVNGFEAMLSLSRWYAVSDGAPWWGTDEWTNCVDRHAGGHSTDRPLDHLLRSAPEALDHLTLCRVLDDAGNPTRSARGLSISA